MGFDGTGGRLVEPREPERRAQFVAACRLPLRDSDGGLQGFLGGRGICGIALKQEFAAGAMQFGLERAMARAVAGRQRFVEDRDGTPKIACPSFSLGQRNLEEPIENQSILLTQVLGTAAHGLESLSGRVAFSYRPAIEEQAEGTPQIQIVVVRKTREFGSVRCGARMVVSN